jgi:hypothetical protein
LSKREERASSPGRRRRLRIAVAGFALACTLLATATLASAGRTDFAAVVLPDLVALLPSQPYATQHTPFYVDTYVKPGQVMYRFDAVLLNQGGVLDVYRDPQSGHVIQALWPAGNASVAPTPHTMPPTNAGVQLVDLTKAGAAFKYVAGGDHNHFHLQHASLYRLLTPGGTLGSAKVGFCLADDYGDMPNRLFPYPYRGEGVAWCAVGRPDAKFFREGISSGAGDIYNSQVQDQWIDVTGLKPGSYTLAASANPDGFLRESNKGNNLTKSPRVIPGTIADNLSVASAGSLQLSGRIVGPEVPARQSSNCFPLAASAACLITDTSSALRFQLATGPCYGKATVGGSTGTTTQARYARTHGAAGQDGFSFVVTDQRGLTSQPGFVKIGRPTSAGAPRACLLGATVDTKRRLHLAFTVNGHVPSGTRWRAYVDSKPDAFGGRGSIVTRALPAGRTGVWVELVDARGRPLSPQVESRELNIFVPASQ